SKFNERREQAGSSRRVWTKKIIARPPIKRRGSNDAEQIGSCARSVSTRQRAGRAPRTAARALRYAASDARRAARDRLHDCAAAPGAARQYGVAQRLWQFRLRGGAGAAVSAWRWRRHAARGAEWPARTTVAGVFDCVEFRQRQL